MVVAPLTPSCAGLVQVMEIGMARSGNWALHQQLLVWDGTLGSNRELGGWRRDWSGDKSWLRVVFLTDNFKDVCGTKGKLM